MFTGIVTATGKISAINGGHLVITPPVGWLPASEVVVGDSIAVNGVCLTVTDLTADQFGVDVSPETRSCTCFGQYAVGQGVHLEAAMRAQDRMGGHWVTGHVDTVAKLKKKEPLEKSLVLTFSVPLSWGDFLAPKGSLALDGVSLTINQVSCEGPEFFFTVCLIPHTQTVTHLGELASGALVHLEIDPMARYVVHAMRQHLKNGDFFPS